MKQAPGPIPHEMGRNVNDQLVNNAGAEHGTGQRRAGLDQHFIDLARRQVLQQWSQFDPLAVTR